MQDLKSLGDKAEVNLGNREVAFLVGALFVVMVVIFGLGVMVGKRLYGPVPAAKATENAAGARAPKGKGSGTAQQQPNRPEPAKVAESPRATTESLTFYKMKEEKVEEAGPEKAPTPPARAPEKVERPAPGPPPSRRAVAEKPSSPPVSPEDKEWKYSIQVGAMTNKSNADEYADRLRDEGWGAWVIALEPKDPEANTVYQVRVGKYLSRNDAEEQLAKLKRTGLVPGDSFIRTRE